MISSMLGFQRADDTLAAHPVTSRLNLTVDGASAVLSMLLWSTKLDVYETTFCTLDVLM